MSDSKFYDVDMDKILEALEVLGLAFYPEMGVDFISIQVDAYGTNPQGKFMFACEKITTANDEKERKKHLEYMITQLEFELIKRNYNE